MLRTKAIRESKRGDRATSQSTAALQNASEWSFFAFDTHIDCKTWKNKLLGNEWSEFELPQKLFRRL